MVRKLRSAQSQWMLALLLFVGLSALAAAEEWSEFSVPQGLFSLQYPKSWQLNIQDSIVSIAQQQGSAAVTVSAYQVKNLKKNFLKGWLAETFKDKSALSPLKTISFHNWFGYQQEYRGVEQSETRDWLAVAARNGDTYVLITINVKTEEMGLVRTIFEKMITTLILHPPLSKEAKAAKTL